MKVIVSPKAEKLLSKFPARESVKITRKLRELEVHPFGGKPLVGQLKGWYVLRAWPYRIIYRIIKEQHLVFIETVEHRQGVYK